MKEENYWLLFNKQQWLMDSIFNWTEEELDNADEKGYIGTKFGTDCYLARRLKVTPDK